MRGYFGLFFFCAVLTFVSPVAPHAAENAAEYRAPVTGAKLGPAQPLQPAPSAAQPQTAGQPPQSGALPAAQNGSSSGAPYTGVQNQPAAPSGAQAPGQPGFSGQSGFSGQPAQAQQAAPQAGGPAPWPSAGGMMPYSALGALPAPASPPDAANQPPAAPGFNGADMAGSPAAPATAQPPAPGYAPVPSPPYGQGSAPYPAAPYPASPYPATPGYGGQGDITYGTSQLPGDTFNDRGIVTQYRDPQTGDIITSVVPPSPPEQQNYGTFFVAPQIYPDGNQWGGNPNGPMPRPGQPYMPPTVIWQPGMQTVMPPDHNRHRHDDRRHDNRRHDERYDGSLPPPPPPPPPHQGSYSGPYAGPHDARNGAYGGGDRRHDERYDPRPGQQGTSPYDQRDADRSRDGRERR